MEWFKPARKDDITFLVDDPLPLLRAPAPAPGEKPFVCRRPNECFFCWAAAEVRLYELERQRWEDDGGPARDERDDVVVLDSLR